MSPERIDARHIERLHLLTTEPPEQLEYDGWLVRTAPHDVKRARSVNSTGASTLPLGEKIAHCERLYAEAGLPALFRLTPFSTPLGLDAELERRGYTVLDRTLQQVARIDVREPASPAGPRFESMPLEAWLEAASSLRGQSSQARVAEYRRLSHREREAHFALGYLGDEVVACGLVSLEGGLATPADIYVSESHRGQGFGRGISAQLLELARRNGAELAWLNVLADNKPAIRTYARLGFQTLYEYWYRIKPAGRSP